MSIAKICEQINATCAKVDFILIFGDARVSLSRKKNAIIRIYEFLYIFLNSIFFGKSILENGDIYFYAIIESNFF